MIFGQTKLELKVGIFVFIGLIILSLFILKISDFKTIATGQPLNFTFDFINGVKIGAPVRFAGVDIGEIKDIKFIQTPEEGRTKVMLMAWVRRDIKIPSDSTIWVNTLGLLGEKYIEVMPGKDFSKLVVPNQVIAGNEPIAMHEVTQLAKNITTDLDTMIVKIKNKEGTLGKLLYDDSIYNELEKSVVDLREELRTYIGGVGSELEDLIKDIKKHPWKLFWKTKEK
jgi:phospholipid/cholesterol/gamma-HCH transport system substrate-binding protein